MPRILLVDDDDLLRTMLRKTLEKLGYEVIEARNGREALNLYPVPPPDVVVTDIVMPDKEGLETITELRRSHPGVKIIAISGGGRGSPTDYLKIARAMGADRTLAKPFPNEDLDQAIRALLAP